MSINEYDRIYDKYIIYFFDDSKTQIRCKSGWLKTIDEMLAAIDLYYSKLVSDQPRKPLYISKIEEKYGCLNVEYEGGDYIVEAIFFYSRTMAFSLCEFCGNPGELYCSSKHAKWSYMKTLCIRHAIEMKYYGLVNK